eukprot:UN02641
MGGPYDFPTDPQKQQSYFNYLSQEIQTEQMGAPYGPLDTLLSATATLGFGVFFLSCGLRWWFADNKPISKHKLIEILSNTYQMWGQGLTAASQQEQQILQQQPNMTAEDKKQLSDYLRYRLLQQFAQAEQQLLEQAMTTKEQVQHAIKEYESDKQVQKLSSDLNKVVGTVIPPPPLPFPWTEADVIKILQALFEKRICVMENAYKHLRLDERPQGVPLTPQMAQDLNDLFNKTLQRELDDFYASHGITAQYLQKLLRSISNSPVYIDLVHTYKQEQQQRYAALGLEVKKR